jgi:hypothetical protein
MAVAEFSSPGQQQAPLGLPGGTTFIEFSTYGTLAHNSSRLSLKDEELWWCENYLPTGKNKLRPLPGVGSTYYTVTGGQITITNAGSGGTDGQYALAFSGGAGAGLAGYFIVLGGSVAAFYITNGGTGYTSNPTVSFAACPGLTGAAATAVPIATSFAVSIVAYYNFNIEFDLYLVIFFADGSANFLKLNSSNVFVSVYTSVAGTFVTNGYSSSNPMGRQWGNKYFVIVGNSATGNGYWIFDGTLLYTAGTVSPIITITNVGSGYVTPVITVSGGSGAGATFTATVVGGQIVGITCTNAGSGYVVADANAPKNLTITDSAGPGAGALATIELMPFGIVGSSVELYEQRVWIVYQDLLIFSAPASPVDFRSASGAGTVESTSSSLRFSYTQLVAQAGFLYLIADSSVSYISGVQTGGTPLVTTFGLTAIDTEFGTVWRDSVQAFSRGVVFATYTGVYVIYGGTVEKISSTIDDMFQTDNLLYASSFGPSSAIVELYGRRYYALLLPIIDDPTNKLAKRILLWNRASWSTATQEYDFNKINWILNSSVTVATASDGYRVYVMMANYSANTLARVVKSKFWDTPGYFIEKSGWRMTGLMIDEILSDVSATSEISIDIENEASAFTYELNYVTDPKWATTGQRRFVIAVEQAGYLLGFTLRTSQPITIQSIALAVQQFRMAL